MTALNHLPSEFWPKQEEAYVLAEDIIQNTQDELGVTLTNKNLGALKQYAADMIWRAMCQGCIEVVTEKHLVEEEGDMEDKIDFFKKMIELEARIRGLQNYIHDDIV